jgi:hypothetical protein
MSADDTPLNSFQSDDCSHQLLTTPLSEAVVPIAKIARAASGVVGMLSEQSTNTSPRLGGNPFSHSRRPSTRINILRYRPRGEKPKHPKREAAVTLGRKGGQNSAAGRMKKIAPAERRRIDSEAAQARRATS